MRRMLTMLLAIAVSGFLLNVNTDAATTSHNATRCSYCKGGDRKECTTKMRISKCSMSELDNVLGYGYEAGMCFICNKEFSSLSQEYTVKATCSGCDWDEYGKVWDPFTVYEGSNFCSTCAGKVAQGGNKWVTSGGEDAGEFGSYCSIASYWHYKMKEVDTNEFEYEYEECSHGKTSGHNLSCSTHSSYSGSSHYYCTTHGYVGSSSTCPGLAVSPSPKNMSLYIGESKSITPNPTPSTASVSYTSSNSSVASVSSSGRVTGKRKVQQQ